MNRIAITKGNTVVNVVMADAEYTPADGYGFVLAPLGVGPEIGWRFADDQWSAPPEPAPLPPTAEEVRAKRDHLLTASDWTQVADAPVNQAAWATYRQELRNIPQQASFPHSVVWPVKPE